MAVPTTFRPVRAGLEIITAIRRRCPEAFAWRAPAGDGSRFFDKLTGTDRVRAAIDRGTPVVDIVGGWGEDVRAFQKLREPYLIYK